MHSWREFSSAEKADGPTGADYWPSLLDGIARAAVGGITSITRRFGTALGGACETNTTPSELSVTTHPCGSRCGQVASVSGGPAAPNRPRADAST